MSRWGQVWNPINVFLLYWSVGSERALTQRASIQKSLIKGRLHCDCDWAHRAPMRIGKDIDQCVSQKWKRVFYDLSNVVGSKSSHLHEMKMISDSCKQSCRIIKLILDFCLKTKLHLVMQHFKVPQQKDINRTRSSWQLEIRQVCRLFLLNNGSCS